MKTHFLFFTAFFISVTSVFSQVSESSSLAAEALLSQKPVLFQENKGQLTDVKGNVVPSVLFKASTTGIDAYITTDGLVYVFRRNEKLKDLPADPFRSGLPESGSTEMEWLQVHLEGADIRTENVVKEFPGLTDYRFFAGHCPNGITGVKEYEKITVKDVYPGIDWVVYGSSKKGMKYDFIVHPGADPGQIRLVYESERPAALDDQGSIGVQLRWGTLTEQAPVSFAGDEGKEVKSAFKSELVDQHRVRVRYAIDDYNTQQLLTIDPHLVWGTLFGSTDAEDMMADITHDSQNNIFICGETGSAGFPLLNAGTYYESVPSASQFTCPFILKFSHNGTLLWSTIYGFGYSSQITCDGNDNVIVVGTMSILMSNNGAIFPVQDNGTYFQWQIPGFDSQSFILKFDNAGNRLWATLYGGTGDEMWPGVTCDGHNNLFVIGTTNSEDFPLYDSGTYFHTGTSAQNLFILKFDDAGNRLWATCYIRVIPGVQSLACDTAGNLFIVGRTNVPNFPVQDAGTYFDGTLGGLSDAFILKFDNAGNRLWATFYGGHEGSEEASTIVVDAAGNVFISGETSSPDFPLQDAGTYLQPFAEQEANISDVFLVKFDNAGNRLWSTCYGGSLHEFTNWTWYYYSHEGNLTTDNCGNIYMGFATFSGDIPTLDPGGGSYFDSIYSAGLFLTKFTGDGTLLWGTYTEGAEGVSTLSMDMDNDQHLNMTGIWEGDGVQAWYADPGNGAWFDTTTHQTTIDFTTTNGYIFQFAPEPSPHAFTFSQADMTCNCTGTATVNQTVGAPPYSYSWSSGSQTIHTPDAANTATDLCIGNQWVVVADCSSRDTVFFTIAEGCAKIDVPNVIILSSKSGNDVFFADTRGLAGFDCVIVNRWGNQIYRYNDPAGTWDGTSNGKPVDEGVYFYRIAATNESGEQLTKEGFVQVYH